MPTQHERAMDILADVLEAPADDRPRAVEQACAGDNALRDEVDRLLAVGLGARAQEFLDALENPPALPSVPPDAGFAGGEGLRFGRYRVVRQIGEGGMGSVFEAEQDHPRRRVALKVIKPGMDSRRVIARFEAEREALALMDHPNIAKVFDAGLDDAGRPFFAMELVNGAPITHYCDEHALAVRDRLELFISVCRAVQHAHHKGIIHRDLKPTNVLVMTIDGKPVPKVIDFGVARAAGPDLTQQTMLTGLGQMVGTLEYMSPEQAELNRQDVDTRSDIYSLGVLLYELLTGTTPLEGKWLKEAALLEALRVIREEEPPRPSTRLSTLAASRTVAARFGTNPKKLRRPVNGELDWIVMKCLEKDRTRRYETAYGLARDVERHLSDEPVAARPPGGGYWLRKFVRRHRVGVGAGVAVALALVIGSGATTAGMLRAMSARAMEVKHRNEADAARADAESVNGFLLEMLESASPTGRGDLVLVRDVLDRAARRLDEGSLASRPRTEATVRHTLGETYDTLTLHAAAEDQLRRSLEMRRALLGEEHREVAHSMDRLAWVIADTGELARAEALLRQAVAMRRKLLGAEHSDVATSLALLGAVLELEGEPAQAEALQRQALVIRRTKLGDSSVDVATSLCALANVLSSQGLLSEAEPLYLEALAIRRKRFGETNLNTVGLRGYIARLYSAQSRFDEAEAIQREVLAGFRNSLGDFHAETINAVRTLDSLHAKQGRLGGEALRALARERPLSTIAAASAELERTGVGSPRAANVLAARGQSYARLGKLNEALADYTRAVELDPSNHFRCFELGALLARLGEREKFAGHCQSALQRFGQSTDRAVAERVAKMLGCVPATFSGVGPQRVVDLAERAVEDGAPHLNMKWFELTRGIADYRAGNFDSAARWLRKSVARDPRPGWRTTEAHFYLAIVLHRLGRGDEAATALREARQAMDSDPLRVGRTDLGNEHHLVTAWVDLGYEYVSVLFCELARLEAEGVLGDRNANRGG